MDNQPTTKSQRAAIEKAARIAEFTRRFPTQEDFFAEFIRLEDALVAHLRTSPDFSYRQHPRKPPAPVVQTAAPVADPDEE